MDDYLQRELEKLQQEEEKECESKNIVNNRDKVVSPGHEQSTPITDGNNGKSIVRKQKTKAKSGQSSKENKKTFTCTFNNCRKNYVKSSHLKVLIRTVDYYRLVLIMPHFRPI